MRPLLRGVFDEGEISTLLGPPHGVGKAKIGVFDHAEHVRHTPSSPSSRRAHR